MTYQDLLDVLNEMSEEELESRVLVTDLKTNQIMVVFDLRNGMLFVRK